jgi:hypothetical protein
MPLRGFAASQAKRQERKGVSNDLAILGGLVEEEHPTAVRPTDLLRARNIVRKGRTTGTRPGLAMNDAAYDAAISGTPGVQGIYEFRRNKDANRDLIVVADGVVYTGDTTSLDKATNSVQITTGDNYLWTFDTFQNKVFAAGGKDTATVDSVWYWTGSGALNKLDLATIGLSAGARYVFSKWNFLFLGGLNGTAYNDNPLVIRYCNWGEDATDATKWAAANCIPGQTLGDNFGPGSYGKEYNTGMGSFQDNRNDFLLMLTNRRIITFAPNPAVAGNSTAFTMVDSIQTGCVGQNAFVNLGVDVGDAVYLSQDGIHSLVQSKEYGNTASNYLSWPIRKTFDSLNRSRLKYASGTYWPNEGLVLFLVTTGSSSTHNLILCMDIKDATVLTHETVRWYKWDFSGINPNFITVSRGTDDVPYVYVGDLSGRVMRFGRNVYSDMDAGIASDFITKNDDYDMPYKQKTIGDTFVALQGNGSYNISHQLLLDDGQRLGQTTLVASPGGGALWGGFNWGEAEWGSNEATIRHRVSSVGTSPTVAHRFSHSTANQPFWICSLTQEVFVSGATADAQANPVG